MCELYMMKRVGDMTLPCGTPLLGSDGFPTVFPSFTLACFSPRKLLVVGSLQSGSSRLTSSNRARRLSYPYLVKCF